MPEGCRKVNFMIEAEHAKTVDRLLDPVIESLTPEAARKLVSLRADARMQKRLDSLADKSTEGLLTAEEREEYESYVHIIDVVSLLQAKARKLLAKLSMS